MNTNDILQLALAQGVVLYMDSDKLKFKARAGGLNDELRGLIKQYKPQIIAHLNEDAQAQAQASHGQAKIALSGSKVAPLSFPQQRLWFIDQMEQGSAQFNLCMALDIKGQFDPAIAEQALQRIVERHQVLRTVYRDSDEGSEQVILDDIQVTLTHHNLADETEAAQAEQLKQFIKADATAKFDLSQDCMVRCSYVDMGESEGQPHGALLFNMHHIASDGWSMDLLVGEFTQQYHTTIHGLPDSLPALPVQYIDYALWQREWLQGEQLQGQLAYWDKQLANVPQLHTLPLDKPRPQTKQYQGATVTQQLDEALTTQLQQLARRLNMTMFMLLHGGLSLMLSRHSNSDDIVVGTMVANRRQVELERLIGFFVNILVLRVNTDFDTVDEYLAHVSQVNLDGQVNQDVPFDQLVERLKIERTLAHTPLYQITLTHDSEKNSGAKDQQSDIQVTPLDSGAVMAKVDINVYAKMNDQGGEILWTYDEAIFSQSHIEQLSEHFGRMLSGLANSVAGTKLAQLPLLSDAEQDVLLNKFNTHNALNLSDSAEPALISQRFEATATSSPENIACVFGEQTLTFSELNSKANQLAHWLNNNGVACGDAVGLCIERSLDMVIGVLAIFKAGGVYVPLDSHIPSQRLAHMINDADIKQIITTQVLCQSIELFADEALNSTPKVLLDSDDTQAQIAACSSDNPKHATQSASSSAYVIYTSGTSGTPKGVLVSHRALDNFCQGFKQQLNDLQLSDNAPWLWNASYAFDASLKNIACLSYGSKVVIASDQESRDAQALVTLLATHQVPVFNGMPLLVEQVVELLQERSDLAINLIASGDDISQEIWQKIADYCQAKGTRAINAYGPTETTVNASYGLITADSPVNMGKPVSGAQCYVLDKNHQLVPQGVSGELYVGGACLANGYLHLEQLTGEYFIDNPFSSSQLNNDASAKLYKTGDRVHQLPDGKLVYLGRMDRQVKIRGYRIELDEIQSALLDIDGITGAVVVGQQNLANHPQLVAYVVFESQEARSESEQIAAQLATHLPEYMLPVQYVELEQLPKTHSGKLDVQALANPFDRLAEGLTDDNEQPLTEIEQTLCEIWAGVLKVDHVGVNDNFFMLGGDSIMSMQLVSKAKKQGLVFNVRQLFKAKTVAELAPMVEIKTAKQAASAQTQAKPAAQNLSYEQQGAQLLDGEIDGSIVLKMNESDAQKVMFCVPPISGRSGCYHNLAVELTPVATVYGLQLPDLFSDMKTCSIEQLAAFYITVIKRVQPLGPYLISGWSSGGTIGYEIATQLRLKGDEVEPVMIFDRRCHFKGDNAEQLKNDPYEGIRQQFQELVTIDWIALREFELNEALDLLVNITITQGVQLEGVEADAIRSHLEQMVTYPIMSNETELKSSDLSINLFQTEESRNRFPTDPMMKWEEIASGQINVIAADGRHSNMIYPPNVSKLATQITACLTQNKP
jgi:amino acid adenylation domain-containing protein